MRKYLKNINKFNIIKAINQTLTIIYKPFEVEHLIALCHVKDSVLTTAITTIELFCLIQVKTYFTL